MNNPDAQTEWITGKGALTIAGAKVELQVTVPAKPVQARQLLPIFQQLTNTVVAVGVSNAEAEGAQISCAKGCGACCRQLVPIAEGEAHQLRQLVAAMPEERRAVIQQRFAAAKAELQQSGLLQAILFPGELSNDAKKQLGLTYFAQGIACPFLQEESCSIHPDRPLACREYLVTSPAANCAAPSADTVHCVEIPASVSRIVQTMTATRSIHWLPMIAALDWAETHPDESPARPGPEWLQSVFTQLTKS